jgi:hypothetical protein
MLHQYRFMPDKCSNNRWQVLAERLDLLVLAELADLLVLADCLSNSY